jgi:tight adherence protein B
LPDLLSQLRSNIQAGSTPQQAMMAVADDIPAPLGDELKTLKRDLNVNVALETAMDDLAKRVPSREMKFLVASVEIAVRSGSDLDPQLATIQEIVQQRTRIRQKLRAAVAQVKPTQILAYGAVPLMFFVSTRTSGNVAYWFGPGIFVLIGAASAYIAGGLAIRFMVKGVENA